MHYAYEVEITPTDTVDNYVVQPIILGSGIIRHVSIYFPSGCSRVVRCQLWDRANQVLPTNPDGWYAHDGASVEADLFYDLDRKGNELYFIAWSIGSSYDHTLTISLDVQGRDEPDPYSIMSLMNDTINRLIQLCRELI